MAQLARKATRRAADVAEQADEARSQVQEKAADPAEGAADAAGGARDRVGKTTLTGELKDTFREGAIEVLKPVMRKATTSAAKYAVTMGPTLVKDRVASKVQEAGGAGAVAKAVASKGRGIGGLVSKLGGARKRGESPSGTGRGRRLPVQEWIDVGVDLDTAYDQFTQFEDWPRFMHRVESIEQRDDSTLMWHENIWGVRRSWEAEITDQLPSERVVWRSTSGPQTIGVVTFHALSDRLTRIYVTLDFQPKGLFEKTSSGMRISRRALKSDLMRFKAFIELRGDATGGWRGTLEDGEVVVEEDAGDEGGEAPEADELDEVGAAEEAEDEDPEEDEEPEEDEADEEPEEAPRPRVRATRAAVRRKPAAPSRRSKR
jgi:uncharacterized membrane protein